MVDLVIGFDTEFVRGCAVGDGLGVPDDDNVVLTYSGAVLNPETGEVAPFLVDPNGVHRRGRISLTHFLMAALDTAFESEIVHHSKRLSVALVAHFTRADLPGFCDFAAKKRPLKKAFQAIRGTYASLSNPTVRTVRATGFRADGVRVSVRLYDTLLLAPPTHRSLAALGDALGYEKIELPKGAIERMDLLRDNLPDLFDKYAIRDAEIAARYFHRWMVFCRDVLGVNGNPPITLGSAAVKMFKSVSPVGINTLRGIGNDKEYLPSARQANALAAECFHGGRNEAYWQGPTPPTARLYDIDLAGAYSTCLVDIRTPDWDAVRATTDRALLTDLDGGMSFVHVDFTFPDDTRFPCLPVRSDAGLIYPLTGASYCTGAELVVAINAGADVEITQGIFVPWADDVRPVLAFSNRVAELRADLKAGGDALSERIVKDIGNSLYGKFAQAVAGMRCDDRGSRSFNTEHGTFEPMEPSAVTQPCLAAHVTGLCRAALSELLNGLPADAVVASATTDGFLSSVPLKSLWTNGPVFSHFKELRRMVSPADPAPLEMKHEVNQAYVIRTRGALTMDGAGTKPIFARCGQRLNDAEHAALRDDDWAHNDRWLEIALSRTYDLTHDRKQLICLAEQWRRDADLIDVPREVRVSLDTDHKRDFHQLETIAVDAASYGPSRPWRKVDDCLKARESFDVWRKRYERVLLTNRDWLDWRSFHARYDKALQTKGGGSVFLQWVRHHMANGTSGFPPPARGRNGWNATRMAARLTELGHSTNPQAMRDAKRMATRVPASLTAADLALRNALEDEFPEVDWP